MNNSTHTVFAAIVKLSILLLALAGTAKAACAATQLSQLQWLDKDGTGQALGSAIQIKGFPALSDSGREVAILLSIDSEKASAVLEIRSAADGRMQKRFVLISDNETEGPWNDHIRQRIEADMVSPNAYLLVGKFRPMEALFDLEPALGWSNQPRDPVWRHEHRGLRVAYTDSTFDANHPRGAPGVLTMDSAKNGKQRLRQEWHPKSSGFYSESMGGTCGSQGVPRKGWISPAGDFVVLYVVNFGGPGHSCDLPEEWLIKRLKE